LSTRYYPAVIEKAKRGFGVFFPDFPGCVSAGTTLDAVMLNAEEALSGHAERMVRDGDPLPEPSGLSDWPSDPEIAEAGRVLVRLDPPGRAKAISVTLPEHLIARIDRSTAGMGHNRSSFLAEGARRLLRDGMEATTATERKAGSRGTR